MKKYSLFLTLIISSVGLNLIGKLFPDAVYFLFAVPSGHAASFFMGQPWLIENGLGMIPTGEIIIKITQDCTGFLFFTILFSYIAAVICTKRTSHPFPYILGALVVCFVVAIMANASRIVCGYYASLLAKGILPLYFQSALHQGIGVSVFLTVLVLMSLFLERIVLHADR